MPFTAVAHTSLENDEINQQIIKLYDISPEFADGQSALINIQKILADGGVLYLGMFNDKPIAGVTVRAGTEKRRLIQYIVVHHANRGRGLAQKLVKDVCKQELTKNTKQEFEAGCGVIHKILTRLELL